MGQLEDFLSGRPLSAENAALQRGEDIEPERNIPLAPEKGRRQAIGREEREWLRRLTVEPGWEILLALQDEMVDAREQSAILLSQQDPIGNQSTVAKEWSYVAVMKEVLRLTRARIDYELTLLREQGDTDDGEVLGE